MAQVRAAIDAGTSPADTEARALAQRWMAMVARDIARVRTAMDEGSAPASPQAQALAREWFDLFRSFAGDHPATQQKIRQALENEPELNQSSMVDEHMRAFLRAAMQSLQRARPAP